MAALWGKSAGTVCERGEWTATAWGMVPGTGLRLRRFVVRTATGRNQIPSLLMGSQAHLVFQAFRGHLGNNVGCKAAGSVFGWVEQGLVPSQVVQIGRWV